jgi:hypothetical protein
VKQVGQRSNVFYSGHTMGDFIFMGICFSMGQELCCIDNKCSGADSGYS